MGILEHGGARRGWRLALKAAGVLLVGVVALAAVVLVRALRLKPAEAQVAPAAPLRLDEAGAVARLAEAVRIPTESRSDEGVDMEQMARLRALIDASFPRVQKEIPREMLASGALLYTWTGQNPAAAPVVLMGHMDMVPPDAATLGQWKHGPYSGDVADGALWGRGTLDDKAQVFSLLEATEALLAEGFRPARTILFAFGVDEENGGKVGAQRMVALLASRGVHPEFVVDEGGLVVDDIVSGLNRPVAAVGLTEKGYMDVRLRTQAKGGHASMPPRQTAIGELSRALARVEAHPFPNSMPEVVAEQYASLAPYMPLSKRVVLANLWLFRPLLFQMSAGNPELAASFHTTVAETMLRAGFKSNALPTGAEATLNLRIVPGQTRQSALDQLRRTIADPAVAVTDSDPATSHDPSPVSPIEAEGYRTLSQTIHQLFPTAVVMPNQLNASTDGSYFAALTPCVYRFLPVQGPMEIVTMAHGINERIAVQEYLRAVRFQAQLMRNLK